MRLRVLAAMTLALVLAASAITVAQRPNAPADLAISQKKDADPAPRELISSPAKGQPDAVGPELSPFPDPPAAATAPAPAPADPMEAVEAFLSRNRKEAADAVASLTKEAEALRARLQKVEAALARWQGVAQALQSPDQPPPAPAELEATKAEAPAEIAPTGPPLDAVPAEPTAPPLPEVPKAAG